MKYFRLTISGRGGELAYGSLTQEQHDFWKDLEEEDIMAHAFGDPWEESDDNPVFDEDDPRFLGNWNEIDDLCHENGAFTNNCVIGVEERRGPGWSDAYAGTQIVSIGWEDFKKIHSPKWIHVDLEEAGSNTPYGFTGFSSEKGTFGEYLIETEDDFDASKLTFCLTALPTGDTIIEVTEYNGIEVDSQGDYTAGKGYYAEIWEN